MQFSTSIADEKEYFPHHQRVSGGEGKKNHEMM